MTFDASQFLTVVGDAVLAVDRQGRILFWNTAAENLFGYSGDEAIGASLDLIIPERHQDRHWQAFFRVMASGETRLGSDLLYVTARRKDGAELRVALTVGVVRSVAGAIESIGAVFREGVAPPRRDAPPKRRTSAASSEPPRSP